MTSPPPEAQTPGPNLFFVWTESHSWHKRKFILRLIVMGFFGFPNRNLSTQNTQIWKTYLLLHGKVTYLLGIFGVVVSLYIMYKYKLIYIYIDIFQYDM